MGYGWCDAYRVYGFSGTLKDGSFLELSEKTLEKLGIECFIESVYKCKPCGIVYGIGIDASGDAPEEVRTKVETAVQYVNKKYGFSFDCDYWLCVDTDMTEIEFSGDSDSSDSESESSEED